MKYNLGVLSAGGLAALFLCGPQSVFAACTGNAVDGFTCQPAGPVAVGAVFSTSETGARQNIALALVEELLEEEEETGGGSGDRMPFDVYATAIYRDRDYETENTPGLDSDTWGGIIGATLRGDNYFAGAAIDYSQEDATFKQNAGNQDTDEWGISLYGTYYPLASKNLFVSGAFRYGDRDIDTRRNVPSENGEIGTAKGSTDGNTYGFLGGAGYSWPLQERTLVSLSGWLLWNQNNTDGYTESGALEQGNGIAGNLRFEDDDYSTLDGILTATLLHSIPITNGRVVPSLSFSYVHEFESDTRTINAEIADPDASPNNTLSIRTNEADENYFRINAAVNIELNQGATLYASYTGTLGHDWRNENLFSIGVSVLF